MALPPLRVLLVRHAESFNNELMHLPGMTMARWRKERVVDPDLSQKGVRQAAALADFLGTGGGASAVLRYVRPIGALRVSPTKRGLRTLQPLARRLGLRPTVWTDCFEELGLYQEAGTANKGLTRSEMREMFPEADLPDDVTEQGWYQLDGQETHAQARVRARVCAERLRRIAGADDRPKGTLLLLTHHGHLSLLLQELLGGRSAGFDHINTATSCIDIHSDGRVSVLFHNRTDHLSGGDDQPQHAHAKI